PEAERLPGTPSPITAIPISPVWRLLLLWSRSWLSRTRRRPQTGGDQALRPILILRSRASGVSKDKADIGHHGFPGDAERRPETARNGHHAPGGEIDAGDPRKTHR